MPGGSERLSACPTGRNHTQFLLSQTAVLLAGADTLALALKLIVKLTGRGIAVEPFVLELEVNLTRSILTLIEASKNDDLRLA